MQEENKMAPAASGHTEIQIRPTSLSASSRRIRTKELGYCFYAHCTGYETRGLVFLQSQGFPQAAEAEEAGVE
jgi:hypothetical protein